jgi:hypothetical protein
MHLRTYFKLASLEDITVSPARLAWSAGNSGIETTGSKLRLEERVDLRNYSDSIST